MIVLWDTLYMQSAIDQLRAEGYPVLDEDIAHLSPHVHDHINMLGRYSRNPKTNRARRAPRRERRMVDVLIPSRTATSHNALRAVCT